MYEASVSVWSIMYLMENFCVHAPGEPCLPDRAWVLAVEMSLGATFMRLPLGQLADILAAQSASPSFVTPSEHTLPALNTICAAESEEHDLLRTLLQAAALGGVNCSASDSYPKMCCSFVQQRQALCSGQAPPMLAPGGTIANQRLASGPQLQCNLQHYLQCSTTLKQLVLGTSNSNCVQELAYSALLQEVQIALIHPSRNLV